jgi:2-haloacid dehalogenase
MHYVRMNISPDRKITAAVFDVGGVLLDWNPRYLYRKLIPDPAEMEWFLSTVCTPEWHDAHDRGASMRESCAALARHWPAYAELIMAWSQRSEEMVGGPIPDGVRLLSRVTGSGLACYALTNMEAETYPGRRQRYDFLGWFKGTVVSGFEGIAKPDREIYQLLLERFGLDPAATLFTDDSRVNVAAAAQAGMDAVLYTGPGAILSRLGLAAQ